MYKKGQMYLTLSKGDNFICVLDNRYTLFYLAFFLFIYHFLSDANKKRFRT